jgi:putative transposase
MRRRHAQRWISLIASSRCRTRLAVGLDDIVVIGARHLLRTLSEYVAYYNGTRTHVSLGKDAPRAAECAATDSAQVVEVLCVGGLRHDYLRRAA